MASGEKKKKPAAKKKPYFANTDAYKKKVAASRKKPVAAAKKPAAKKTVKMGKKSIVSKITSRRSRRKSENKWVLGEKLTKAGRTRAKARKMGAPSAATLSKVTKEDKARKKKIGAKATTAVRKGAKSVVKTKGGEYVKYGKKTEAAKSFRSTFKSKCAGGAKSFSWDGRNYSCGKAGPSKPKKRISRGGPRGSAEAGDR